MSATKTPEEIATGITYHRATNGGTITVEEMRTAIIRAIELDRSQRAPIGGFRVVNNVTGEAVSRVFKDREAANGTCYGLNLSAGPGGLYGVERSTTDGGWERDL